MTSRRIILLVAAWLAPAALTPAAAIASCGSDQCPIELHTRWEHQRFSLDLTQQYLDQDQPRAGTEDVPVGYIPSHEDEVRTINRITSLRATWRPTESWILAGSLPYVNRTHEHIMNDPGNPSEYMIWNYEGVGDMEVGASRHLFSRGEDRTFEFRISGGLKMPTGRTTVPEVMGEQPEVPARPGTGSWDGSLGAASRWLISTPTPGGDRGTMPLRLGVVGRWNGTGTDDYRVGNEVQAHLSAEYPLTRALGFLLQGNWRSQQNDEEAPGEEDENTGGTWAYATPGLSLQVGGQSRIYGLVQIPVYQRVNGIQLVSDYNIYVGASRGMF